VNTRMTPDFMQSPSPQQRVEANRRNALASTGPRSDEGKVRAKRNSLRHGLLSKEVVIMHGEGAEDPDEFAALVQSLRDDRQPVGALELILVEQIAVCYWRLRRALRCEVGEIRRGFVPSLVGPAMNDLLESYGQAANAEFDAIRTHLSLPATPVMEKILRYETTIYRQLNQALLTLERLQRARKGDPVAPPLSIHLSE